MPPLNIWHCCSSLQAFAAQRSFRLTTRVPGACFFLLLLLFTPPPIFWMDDQAVLPASHHWPTDCGSASLFVLPSLKGSLWWEQKKKKDLDFQLNWQKLFFFFFFQTLPNRRVLNLSWITLRLGAPRLNPVWRNRLSRDKKDPGKLWLQGTTWQDIDQSESAQPDGTVMRGCWINAWLRSINGFIHVEYCNYSSLFILHTSLDFPRWQIKGLICIKTEFIASGINSSYKIWYDWLLFYLGYLSLIESVNRQKGFCSS